MFLAMTVILIAVIVGVGLALYNSKQHSTLSCVGSFVLTIIVTVLIAYIPCAVISNAVNCDNDTIADEHKEDKKIEYFTIGEEQRLFIATNDKIQFFDGKVFFDLRNDSSSKFFYIEGEEEPYVKIIETWRRFKSSSWALWDEDDKVLSTKYEIYIPKDAVNANSFSFQLKKGE